MLNNSQPGGIMGCGNTVSESAQRETEELLLEHYNSVLAPRLYRRNHSAFCKERIRSLPQWVQGLHCSRPWLVYWTLQAADLLGILPELYDTVASPVALRHCLQLSFSYDLAAEDLLVRTSNPDEASIDKDLRCGGFGGGPGQVPHLASSYAAIMSLLILEETVGPIKAKQEHQAATANPISTSTATSGYEASLVKWESLADVPWRAVSNWFRVLSLDARHSPHTTETSSTKLTSTSSNEERLRQITNGGFTMHIGGECDVRASYIVAVSTWGIRKVLAKQGIAVFTNEWTNSYVNKESWDYVLRCQKAEGGFSCGPLSPEAHGGYGQCALAALVCWYKDIVKLYEEEPKQMPLPNLLELGRWLTQRQMASEGGFQGRTNKLVDSCYSHWIGTTFVLLEVLRAQIKSSKESLTIIELLQLNSAGLIDLAGSGQDCSEALQALTGKEENELVLSGEAIVNEIVTRVSNGEGAKVEAVEAFLQCGNQQDTNTNMTKGPDATRRTRMDEDAADDEDAHFEDINEGEVIGKALARYNNDGNGYLLCNQRRLQQYVLSYCQEINAPSAVAPQAPPVGSVELPTQPNAIDADLDKNSPDDTLLQEALAAAISAISPSSTSGEGGLMDKPGHPNDNYHTCYSLSGVASMQQSGLLAEYKKNYKNCQQARNSLEPAPTELFFNLIEKLQDKALLPPCADSNSVISETGATKYCGGYDGVVVGRVQEDRFYSNALLGPKEPPTSQQDSILAPTNPMANVAARHVR